MKKTAVVAALSLLGTAAGAADICTGYGPQTPRDITSTGGTNSRVFEFAPRADALNLCNIHFHAQAEHRGPGFLQSAGPHGFRCNGSTPAIVTHDGKSADAATPHDATPAHDTPANPHSLNADVVLAKSPDICHGVSAGDTIEVHWVFSSCDVRPGEGLGACLSDKCANPQLRVETQVFLVTDNGTGRDFSDYDYRGDPVDGLHQPRALPTGTGAPVSFHGSTTGPKYSQSTCSPMQVTWRVRPECAPVELASLNRWCADNAFKENHAHGVRALVTEASLLAPIH